jgi:adenosylhomocysteine/aminodeoxyfutalosine nucleosidase
MKIAVMGAMPEEIEPILERMDSYETIEYAKNIYYEGKYRGIDVVVAYSKIGKVFATLTATILLEKFKCDTLLFSGVAGGLNPDFQIGDLVIASKLSQFDLDITVFGHPHGYVPEGQVYIEADKRLRELAKEIADRKDIKLFEGIIATGDQFVSSDDTKEFIYDIFKADAVEMEGASVAVVCDSLDIPFFILRAISDTANSDAGVDFDKFLEESAKISADFILDMVEELGKSSS